MAELGRLLLGTHGEILNGVVDDARGFPPEVDDTGSVVQRKTGDEGELRSTVAHALEFAAIFVLFPVGFFVKEIDVVDGEDESSATALGTEGCSLVDGVPDVVVGHGEGELAADVVALEVADIVAESADVVLGDEKRDVEAVGEVGSILLIPAPIVEGYLPKAAHWMAQNA